MFSISKLARNNWLAAAFLILLCAALLLPGLGASSVSRQQELRVLLAAREMAEGGSWIVPHFMGAERLRKPPLMYWLVASAFKAAGTTESAAAARAISAAAGTAFVLATFFLGRRLIGRRAAFVGAIILATSVGFLRHARLAETDIPQALFCSLTIFSIFTALTVRTGNLKHWIFAGIFSGIGFMFKGPASVAMPIAAVATFIFVARSHRAALTLRGIIVALVICAAIAAPWYIAVALKTANTNAQAGDEINRLLTESAHKGPIFYYVWTLPARLGIWALALPVAIFGAAKKLRHHRGPLYLLCWLASSFAILSALSSKQNHYALLLFAPSALLTGWLLAEAARKLPIIGKDETAPRFLLRLRARLSHRALPDRAGGRLPDFRGMVFRMPDFLAARFRLGRRVCFGACRGRAVPAFFPLRCHRADGCLRRCPGLCDGNPCVAARTDR